MATGEPLWSGADRSWPFSGIIQVGWIPLQKRHLQSLEIYPEVWPAMWIVLIIAIKSVRNGLNISNTNRI